MPKQRYSGGGTDGLYVRWASRLETVRTNEPRRYGSIAMLHPDRRDEYVMLHAHIWPDVKEVLHSHGIRNHSIFISGNVLFR